MPHADSIPSPFRAELIRELKRIRRTCEADGTTGLGFDCMFQHIRFANLPNAPKGTNAVYFIKREMRELLACREFAGFLLE